jgi:hypothetical protein
MPDLQGQRDWIVGQLTDMAEQALPKVKAIRRQRGRLSRAEQIRRFQAGTEIRRLEAGEITPEQFEEYVAHFTKELGGDNA